MLCTSILPAHAQIHITFTNHYTEQPLEIICVVGTENDGKVEAAYDEDDEPKLIEFILQPARIKGRVAQMVVPQKYVVQDESDCIIQIVFWNTDEQNPKILYSIKLLSDPLQKGQVDIRALKQSKVRISHHR